MNVFRICQECNTEFEVDMEQSNHVMGDVGSISTMQNCTHCGKRNDIWIRITNDSAPVQIGDNNTQTNNFN